MPISASPLRTLPLFVALLTALLPRALLAQARDSATVVPGPHYEAEGLKARILGTDYRDLWTTPIQVPVLDLEGFAGGLTPLQRGGGKQTRSLRFRGADGREYNFRSVDKDQTGGLHPDFQNTLIDRLIQDQVHSKHPAASLVAHPLLEAAGILHPVPVLYQMPDHPRLGEFRQEFARMLGQLEIHPNEGEGDRPGFAGSRSVVGTDRLLEHLEEHPRNQVASHEYLKVRLLDFLMGDPDRHPAQWRWARFDEGEGERTVRRWRPVPEDRDNAFSDYDGWMMQLLRPTAPLLVEFEAHYPPIASLTANSQLLDRRLLAGVPRETYDSLALHLQQVISDEVIERAIRAQPEEHYRLRGAEMAAKLRSRRALLPEVARAFYAHFSSHVDLRATDEPEWALLERHPDGSVAVSLFHAPGGRTREHPYLQRRFLPEETQEVRLYLHGGGDRAVVRGSEGESPLILRVIGGGGDDVLTDSARGRTVFYDHRGDNLFLTTTETGVDRSEYEPPAPVTRGFNENQPASRDWGEERQWFRPRAEWRSDIGPVLGGGPLHTRYGFRRHPFARQLGLDVLYAPLHHRFGLELHGTLYRTHTPSRFTLFAQASELEVTRFHGFGNETEDLEDDRSHLWETEFRVSPLYHHSIARGTEIFAGPVLAYTRPEREDGPARPVRPFGSDPFGQWGARMGGEMDRRDLPSFPRRGFRLRLESSAFSATGREEALFGGLDALATGYLPLPLPLESTLAARVGGRMAWGEFPLQEAAFVGGSSSLRGYPRQRFAGDQALFANLEMRSFLTRFHFISRGDLGLLLSADAGRVFWDRERSSLWHASTGIGLWVGILDRTRTFSLLYARGEEGSLYLTFGLPF